MCAHFIWWPTPQRRRSGSKPSSVALSAAAWGLCCELLQLWVQPELRLQGIGSRLMDAFEAEEQERGCQMVYLKTFSFQAPSFYLARGYEVALRTEGFTGGVVKFTLQKRRFA